MAFTYFLKRIIVILFVLPLLISCTKESTPPAATPTETGSPYSVEIILNNWTYNAGAFQTTFSMPEGANSVYVNNKGVKQQIGPDPIDYSVGSKGSEYFMGKLWLNVYGDEAVLSFSDASNINPGTIAIDISGTK
jgi:hypothetical protein